MKRDWICVCETSNFERNFECRNCRRPKEEGMREEIDVDIMQQRQDKNNQNKSKHNKDSGPPTKESDPTLTENTQLMKRLRRKPAGKGRGAILRCRHCKRKMKIQ